MPIARTFDTDLSRSLPLDLHLNLREGANVESLTAELLVNDPRQRPSDREKFVKALNVLCANLLKVHDIDKDAFLAVSRQSRSYIQDRYNSSGFGFRPFKSVLDKLEENEYVEIQLGFNDRRSGVGKVSRMRALPSLVAQLTGSPDGRLPLPSLERNEAAEIIKLRDQAKDYIPYEDTQESSQMRSQLAEWNAFAKSFWVDLFVTDDEFNQVMLRAREEDEPDTSNPAGKEDRPRFVDLTKNSLYRIFNNGVWTDGGRLYGGWWQHVPKAYRNRITINGWSAIELDYSNMLVAMLYAREGLSFDGDAYAISGIDGRYRNLIKKEVFKLINAREGQRTEVPKRRELPPGYSYSRLKEAIAGRNAPIAEYFNSGIGIKMQRTDSDIANSVINAMRCDDVLALPIHDSFIVPQAAANVLTMNMVGAYFWKTGKEPRITISEHSLNPVTSNPEVGSYQAYHQRHREFFGADRWEKMWRAIVEAENANRQRQAAE
jgi:hypothetical protein